jgi:rhodanese-related sulfurtransferase
VPVEEDLPYPEVTRISVSAAKAAFDAGTAVFVDTRDADDFAAGHLPTAVNIPSAKPRRAIPNSRAGCTIITYCA